MAKRSKYGNIKVTHFGHTFDSKKEGNRYLTLLEKEQKGQITDLVLQPRFDMIVNGVNCGFYKADFGYVDSTGATVIEDVKGVQTAVFKLKRKIVEALYDITITLT